MCQLCQLTIWVNTIVYAGNGEKSWFFSSQIHLGECLFFVAYPYPFPSSFPLFAEFSLLRCTRLCLDMFWEEKIGRFFPYDQFTIRERRGYSQAVLTPNAAEFRRLCKAMGGEADFFLPQNLVNWHGAVGTIRPKDIGQLGSKAFFVFSIGVWQRSCFGALLELKRSEPTWKYIKSDKFSRSIT